MEAVKHLMPLLKDKYLRKETITSLKKISRHVKICVQWTDVEENQRREAEAQAEELNAIADRLERYE